MPSTLEIPGWKLEKDKDSDILKCVGKIKSYRPIYLEDKSYVQKLIRLAHEQTRHMGVANTMAPWSHKVSDIKYIPNEG